jgi:ketosteroid isomerase-like protein
MTSKTATITDRLVDAFRAADWEAITDTYAPDVLLDMNLPTWRFQLQGRDAASKYFIETTKRFRNLHLVGLEVHEAGNTLVVEEEMRFDGDGGEYLWRAVDIFRIDGDAVVEHVEYCTGCWPPEQIARQAAEAPMVRW